MDSGLIALIVITLIRFFVPWTIFRWPLAGALLAILADISDVMVFERFGAGPLSGDLYHNFDKVFDMWYLFFEFMLALKWKSSLARGTALFLFVWRFSGFAVFEFSTMLGYGKAFRPAFTLAPNLFEHWYLTWTVIKKWWPNFVLTKTKLFVLLLIVGVPKLVQ